MALQPSQLILCGRRHSVSTANIRIAAHLKNIPLHFQSPRDSPLLKDSPHLRKLSNTSPILNAIYNNGESLVLTQSLGILDLLEDSYPGRRHLIPSVTDMTARCKVKDLAALIVCAVEPMQGWNILHELHRLDQDPMAWARTLLARGMRAFEGMAEKSAGVFSVGNEVSIADICLVTMVQASYEYGLCFDRRTNKFGTMAYPTVQRIVKECEKIPGFTQAGVPKGRFRQDVAESIDGGKRTPYTVPTWSPYVRDVTRSLMSPSIGITLDQPK